MKKILALLTITSSLLFSGVIGSGGVDSIRKADKLSGIQFYRITCNNSSSKVVGKRSSGWWINSGYSQFGEKYRYLSLEDFASKACN